MTAQPIIRKDRVKCLGHRRLSRIVGENRRITSKARRGTASLLLGDTLFAGKPRKLIPHEFVLDAIAPLSPRTRPMFGCLAVYVFVDRCLMAFHTADIVSSAGVPRPLRHTHRK